MHEVLFEPTFVPSSLVEIKIPPTMYAFCAYKTSGEHESRFRAVRSGRGRNGVSLGSACY